jgi:large subunit ribosomal protein L10e
MGLRPGHCYCRNVNKRAYTRVATRVHKKNFVGGVPGLRIRQFHMGHGQRDYTHVIHFVTKEKIQIRDNALEAARITVVRQLNRKLTPQNYYMKLRVYPQFFLRENKQAQGAHADRIQQGMSQCPFGKVVARASRVRPNQKIFSILVDEKDIPTVRAILKKAGAKFPCKMGIVVEENKGNLKSVGTTKKKRKLEMERAKREAEEAKEAEEKEETTESETKKEELKAKEGTQKEETKKETKE